MTDPSICVERQRGNIGLYNGKGMVVPFRTTAASGFGYFVIASISSIRSEGEVILILPKPTGRLPLSKLDIGNSAMNASSKTLPRAPAGEQPVVDAHLWAVQAHCRSKEYLWNDRNLAMSMSIMHTPGFHCTHSVDPPKYGEPY